MDESKISTRYAKAFLEHATEKQLLEIARADMELIFEACKDPGFKKILNNPIIPGFKKRQIFLDIFQGNVDQITIALLDLVLKNRRESFLPSIAKRFIDDYKQINGIKTANLKSVEGLDENQRQMLITSIEAIFQSKIELEESIDKSLLGGFVLTVGDQQYDASVASKLVNIKQQLIETTFENE